MGVCVYVCLFTSIGVYLDACIGYVYMDECVCRRVSRGRGLGPPPRN